MRSADPAVELDGVGKRYDVHRVSHDTLRATLAQRTWRHGREVVWAVRDVSLRVRRGEALALQGANGSGKSTLLRLMAGIERPTAGRLRVDGPVAAVLALGVGFSEHLSGEENLEVAGGLMGLTRAEVRRIRPAVAEFSGLGVDLQRPVREYSSGMIARLGFALAVHSPGEILLVDEVLAAGDREFRERCTSRIDSFRRAGGTLVFASHDPELVEALADRSILMRNGLLHGTGGPQAPSADDGP